MESVSNFRYEKKPLANYNKQSNDKFSFKSLNALSHYILKFSGGTSNEINKTFR